MHHLKGDNEKSLVGPAKLFGKLSFPTVEYLHVIVNNKTKHVNLHIIYLRQIPIIASYELYIPISIYFQHNA